MDRNINESIRKPRRARNTPFALQRNFYALGVVALGGFFWWIFELSPGTKKLKKSQLEEGLFDTPSEIKSRFKQAELSVSQPGLDGILRKYRARQDAKEDAQYEEPSKPQPCSSKNEKISKYFTKITENNALTSAMDVEPTESSDSSSSLSPYKNHIGDLKPNINDSATELNDFKTPTPINKISKIVQLKPPKEQKKKRRKVTSKKTPIRKAADNYFKTIDVNPDHLQMAIALSESSYQAENPNGSVPSSSQEKADSFRKALEKYGFNCGKNKLSGEHKLPKKPTNTKSKYRYITPILYIRTAEDQQSLITSKVSLILAQNSRQNIEKNFNESTSSDLRIPSQYLQIHNSGTKIYDLNKMDLENLNIGDRFLIKTLKLDPPLTKCGHLLKNWEEIAGRDPSPTRTTNSSVESVEQISIDGLIATTNEERSPSSPKKLTASFIETNLPETSITLINCDSPSKVISKMDRRSISPCKSEFDQSEKSPQHSRFLLDSNMTFREIASPTLEEPSLRTFAGFNEDIHESPALPSSSNSLSNDAVKETENCIKISSSVGSSNLATDFRSRSITPDLFDSDGEVEFCNPETLSKNSTTASACKSTTQDVECYNLIQSSDDESMPYDEEKAVLLSNEESLNKTSVYNIDVNCERKENSMNSTNVNVSNSANQDFCLDFSSDLNVTEYVHQMLNKNSNCKSLNNSRNNEFCNGIFFEDVLEPPIFNESDNLKPTSAAVELEQDSSDDKNSEENISLSQESIVISDDELNYSSTYHTPQNKKFRQIKKQIKYNLSDLDETDDQDLASNLDLGVSYLDQSPKKIQTNQDHVLDDSLNQVFNNTHLLNELETKVSKPIDHKQDNKIVSPVHKQVEIAGITTPDNGFQIKTKNVTPMGDYDKMNTPKVTKELEKFGLKPLKRQRGVQLLKYIYESTHPLVEAKENVSSMDEDEKIVKKRKTWNKTDAKLGQNSRDNSLAKPPEIAGGIVQESNENGDNLIFEKTQSKKIPSCRIPLQIVWHNFVTSNPNIRENILLYEPLQLEVLHSMLKEQGFKFNIQDLLTFLDKMCITVRTNQGQGGRARKKSK